MDEINNKDKQKSSTLKKEQKVAFALFVIIGLFAVIFGFKSFGANISRPFDLQLASYKGPEVLLSDELEAKEIQDQKTSDTDSDSITDYDEIYIYKTSPYLKDSDSDGFDDKTEVFTGNDPNCPTGKDCGRSMVTAIDAEPLVSLTPSELLEGMPGSGTNTGAPGTVVSDASLPKSFEIEGVTFDSVNDITDFLSTLGPDTIRSLLEERGIPKETLEGIDDETLMQLFTQAASEANENGEFDEILNETKE